MTDTMKLTAAGAALMRAIGARRFSYFDDGIREDSGIWHECLTGEAMGLDGLPATAKGVSGVVRRLSEQGVLRVTDTGDDEGAWVDLTVLGAEFAQQLAGDASASSSSRKPKRTRAKSSAPKIDPDVELAELRRLMKVTRDRRWRAGRRGDAELVAEMEAKLDELSARAADLRASR